MLMPGLIPESTYRYEIKKISQKLVYVGELVI